MKTLKVAAAIALSAALLYLGTGLHPIPWLTWLAPLPVFLLAPRVGAGTALAAAFTAWLAGQTAMWAYFLNVLQMPLPAAALVQLVPALVFGLAVVAARALTLRGHLLSGVVIVPSCWVTMEYAMSVVLPHGAWASLAYTQTDVLPILQTASVTGVWGITFLLMAVPSALAALLTPASLVRRTPLAGAPLSRAIALNPGQVRMAVIFGSVVIAALGYGGWQLRATPQPRPDKVALVATDHPDDVVSLSTPQGHDLVDHYVTSIDKLAKDGARVVVLPEKTFLADDKSLPTLARPLTRIARTHHVDVVAGLVLSKAGASYNVALAFPAGGGKPVQYTKQHLIPGLEDELNPGGDLVFMPDTSWGLIICKDLDFPDLVRSYRAAGATALYAPSWDFDHPDGSDGRLHSRMAIVRGVESGLSIARVPRAGIMVISDPNGRVVAQAATKTAPFVSVTASLPAPAAPTLYARFGDWFAWTCFALLVSALATLLRTHRSRPIASTPPKAPSRASA